MFCVEGALLKLTACVRTSGENIGDTGLIQAYRAWKAQFDASDEAGNEYLLPGLNFTRCVSCYTPPSLPILISLRSDQLFFISFARAWAQNIKPAAAVRSIILRIDSNTHAPSILSGRASSDGSSFTQRIPRRRHRVQHTRVCESFQVLPQSQGWCTHTAHDPPVLIEFIL